MRRVFIAAMAVLLAAGGAALAQETAAERPALAPAEARRADIAVFREQFMARDKSFGAPARAEAEARLAQLEAGAASVSQAYFTLEIARIAALADNGHTGMAHWSRSREFNRVRVRLAPFGEDYYVLRATDENADLLGARLLAVDGRAMSALREAARTLQGGLPSWRDREAGAFFESPEQLHALGLAARPDRASYRFRLRNGRTVTRRLTPEPANPERGREYVARLYYPQLTTPQGDGWRSLLAVEAAPWALQDEEARFRMRDAPEIDAFVIELRQNVSAENADIAEFMLDSLEAARLSGRTNIVLDMRMNGGGDLNNTRAWVRRLPRVAPGRVFVLTSPFTFSAAISTLGYLEQSAPDRVVIVGEPVGDRLDFYAEGGMSARLSSDVYIDYATERHDYRTGCRGIENCHGSVVRHPIAVESLVPDIEAPWTIEAYIAGRDPALEAVAAALR